MNVEAIAAPAAPAPESAWQRWLVLLLATAGVMLAIYGFAMTWSAADIVLKARVYYTILLATSVAMFVVSWLVAWRAGHSVANLSIALALTAIFLNDTLSVALIMLGLENSRTSEVIGALTFCLGAGLFIRASQYFPRYVSAPLIAVSPTRLGKIRVTRAALTAMLKPAVLWTVVVILSAVGAWSRDGLLADVTRLCILAIGIAYFYLSYRAGDPEVQRKVLWFLAAVIATAAAAIIAVPVDLLLVDEASATFRTLILITLQSLSSLALIVCVAAAVFYAGAISPVLVIRKTVVYGLTTALLLFVFATVEVFLHHQIVHFLHVTDTLASSLIGGVFGLTFHPVKHYFEGLLARFQGKKHGH